MTTNVPSKMKFVDIGANLLDERFTHGRYHGKDRHDSDWEDMIQRAAHVGLTHIILTAGTLQESRKAVQKVRELRQQQQQTGNSTAATVPMNFYCTVGVHPTRCLEFETGGSNNRDDDKNALVVRAPPADGDVAQQHLNDLLEVALDGMSDGCVVAVGEMGLDYDRLEFCPKDVQHKYLIKQLQGLAKPTGLPLFLHNRNVGTDLYDILNAHHDCWTSGGVIHSFDDTLDLANQFINMGFYIGLNGCSLRTESNLHVAKNLALENILLETDCPYCEIKKTHAGYYPWVAQQTKNWESRDEKKFQRGMMVKGRNEPCQIIQVASVIAGARGISLEEVANACYDNTMKLYKFR